MRIYRTYLHAHISHILRGVAGVFLSMFACSHCFYCIFLGSIWTISFILWPFLPFDCFSPFWVILDFYVPQTSHICVFAKNYWHILEKCIFYELVCISSFFLMNASKFSPEEPQGKWPEMRMADRALTPGVHHNLSIQGFFLLLCFS